MWSNSAALGRRARRVALAAVLGVLFSCPPDGARADPVELERLIQAFDEVVFGTDLAGAQGQRHVAKWRGPVSVSLRVDHAGVVAGTDGSAGAGGTAGTAPPAWVRDAVRAHLARLRDLTGLEMALVDDRDAGAGIRITLTSRLGLDTIAFDGVPAAMMRQLRGPGRCFFVYWLGRPGVIARAEIVINDQLDQDHIRHCLVEEITQSLGLPNDTDVARPSVFSDHDRLLELS
ncbi:MAG: DUF2927 domain-containing protein, partial [Proteobacteria bacterium]|nr:DUF2927 domain-containing protein [Pseudomonadota bacterium]